MKQSSKARSRYNVNVFRNTNSNSNPDSDELSFSVSFFSAFSFILHHIKRVKWPMQCKEFVISIIILTTDGRHKEFHSGLKPQTRLATRLDRLLSQFRSVFNLNSRCDAEFRIQSSLEFELICFPIHTLDEPTCDL